MEKSRSELIRLWHRVQDSKRIGENWSLYEHPEEVGFAVWTDRMHEYKEGRQILTLRDLLKVARKDYKAPEGNNGNHLLLRTILKHYDEIKKGNP